MMVRLPEYSSSDKTDHKLSTKQESRSICLKLNSSYSHSKWSIKASNLPLDMIWNYIDPRVEKKKVGKLKNKLKNVIELLHKD